MAPRVRNGSRYRRNAQACVQSGQPCRRCGQPIDLELTKRARHKHLADGHTPNPDYNHPMGGTAGHIVSVEELRRAGMEHMANEPSNLAPEHRRCNSQHGNALMRQMQQQATGERTWSREW